MKETKELCEAVEKLDSSYMTITSSDRMVKQSEDLNRYNEALMKLGSRLSEIEIPEEYEQPIEEAQRYKNITFVENRAAVEGAMNTIVEALEKLDRINFKKLQPEYLSKLVHLLIALCRQGNQQIHNDISLIAQLDRDAFDFIQAHEKLEAFKNSNAALQKHSKNQRAELRKQMKKIDSLQEERN